MSPTLVPSPLSIKKSSQSPSSSKPHVESSVYTNLIGALKGRASSPAKKSSSTTAPITKKHSPFSFFSSSKAPKLAPSVSPAGPVAVPISRPVGPKPIQSTRPLPALPSSASPPPLPPKSTPVISPITPRPRPAPIITSQSLRSPRPSAAFAAPATLPRPGHHRSQTTIPQTTIPLSPPPRPSHTRVLSKPKNEPRSPVSPEPKPEESKPSSVERQSPTRPRSNRTPTSPPSAYPLYPMKPPVRTMTRKRSKTFPDPSEPVAPVPPPQSLSRSMDTANRILIAFDPSPRMNTPEPTPPPTSPRSTTRSPTLNQPKSPTPDKKMFMSIPSRARATPSSSISSKETRSIPSASTAVDPPSVRVRPTRVTSQQPPISKPSSAPPGRASFDTSPFRSAPSLGPRSSPVPPSRPGLAPRSSPIPSRKISRPKLRPLQTTPVSTPSRRVASPVTPDTQPSSASPKTPAAYAEPSYLTSDDERPRSKKHTLRTLFGRKPRPDSLVSSTTAISGSGNSNASTFGIYRPSRADLKATPATTMKDLQEEDEIVAIGTETRHGIRRHAHPPADVPYPVSFEEMVLHGEKHTQELMATVFNQKAYHFTPIENFSKLKNVLDLGCGRGYWVTEAVRECKHANFVGFDIVDVFLSQAEMRDRRGLSDSHISRIEFVQGNFFSTLPFPSDHFDFIRLAFLELAIPESKWFIVLREAWRVLKPGGHLEVIIESQLFPTVWSYQRLSVHDTLENEFRSMLEARDIPPATNIGEKMFFDPFVRVQTHQHVSVCIAPRPAGRSSLDGPTSPRTYGSMRSVASPWSSEPLFSNNRNLASPTEERGRPSFDRSRPSMDKVRPSLDVLPPVGQTVSSRTCTVPGIVILPDTFVPVSEENLYNYASHGAMILNATRLASFTDAHPIAAMDEQEDAWREHVEKYWTYERSNRLRLGFRMKQFDDDDAPEESPTQGRWKWAKCEEDLERPLEIRRFRAWSLAKPGGSR